MQKYAGFQSNLEKSRKY